MNSKSEKLKCILKEMEQVLIAYSGGVDSTFLLKVAVDTLGTENVLAVIAVSETYPAEDLKQARSLAKTMKAKLKVIKTRELKNKKFKENNPDRCYWCKKELFTELKKIARENKIKYLLDASNKDDLKDYRPGAKAKKEKGIRSPLQEAGFTKALIRKESKKLKLKTWDYPSQACLASRIPYGQEIRPRMLNQVNKAEQYLKRLGFKQVRVRDHKGIARIEILCYYIPLLLNINTSNRINKYFKKLGFQYVTLDLEGYRTGSMNEVLKENLAA